MSALGPVEPPRRIERTEPPRRIGERPHREEHEGRGRRDPDADEPRDDEPEDDLPHVDIRV